MSESFLNENLLDELIKIAKMMGIDVDKLKKRLEGKTTIDSPNLNSKIVGSSWKSCNSYRSRGGLSHFSKNLFVKKSSSNFEITYEGPSSGINISHANDSSSDTIHQLYNVLICEINPFLAKGNLKPVINSITTKSSFIKPNHKLTISVPLKRDSKTWQLDRRGGWGHDPGPSKMDAKCKELKGKCEGPIRNVSSGKFGKITEYFITHTI